MNPSGKTALITGGAGGIGKALALRLARGKAKVVIWDLSQAAIDAACRELSAHGQVRGYAVDVTDRGRVAEAAERVLREVGDVDILDNNAGVVFGGDFLDCAEEGLLKTIEVNLNAVMWVTRAFLPGMIRKGSGRVVMMSSAAGLLGVPGMAAYCASKHAVIGLAESIRLELRKRGHAGIGLTVVCPSFVKTGMFEGVEPPLLTPWLSAERIADKIYEAILKDRAWVREPFMVKLVPLLKGLAGQALLDRLGDWLGMHRAMERWKGR